MSDQLDQLDQIRQTWLQYVKSQRVIQEARAAAARGVVSPEMRAASDEAVLITRKAFLEMNRLLSCDPNSP